jgi:hypothetical protein
MVRVHFKFLYFLTRSKLFDLLFKLRKREDGTDPTILERGGYASRFGTRGE